MPGFFARDGNQCPDEVDERMLAYGGSESNHHLGSAAMLSQVQSRRAVNLSLSVVLVAGCALLLRTSWGQFSASAPTAPVVVQPYWWKGSINAARASPQATPLGLAPPAAQPGGFLLPGKFGSGTLGDEAVGSPDEFVLAAPVVVSQSIFPIRICEPDEAKCPPEWATAATGGFFCRTNKRCSPWREGGGFFSAEECPDQCSVGSLPSTRTETVTITSLTVTTTTAYPGEGIKLFCWSFAMPNYEMDILRRQKELSAGIFGCNEQIVLSFEPIGDMNVAVVQRIDSGISKDGSSANALQFMKAWDTIRDDGRWERHDWVVKVDPDAVLLPDRLRIHVNAFNGANAYIRNCGMPMAEGTMMFGDMEAISNAAMGGYFANSGACYNELPWQGWGEDLFMMRCLERAGTAPMEDFSISQDGLCNGGWCGDNWAAVFHPFKDVSAWEGCWHEAVGAR